MCLLTGASCSSDKKAEKKKVTAKVQSAPYELLVVANKDWLKSGAGQSLVKAVETPIDGLPQGLSGVPLPGELSFHSLLLAG